MVRRFIFDVDEGVTRMLPTLPPWNFRMRSSTMNCSTILGMPMAFLSAYQPTAAGWSVRMKSFSAVWERRSRLRPWG